MRARDITLKGRKGKYQRNSINFGNRTKFKFDTDLMKIIVEKNCLKMKN